MGRGSGGWRRNRGNIVAPADLDPLLDEKERTCWSTSRGVAIVLTDKYTFIAHPELLQTATSS